MHLACFNIGPTPIELVELLVERYPKAREMKDKWGWTPLHLAKKYEMDEDVRELLGEVIVRESDDSSYESDDSSYESDDDSVQLADEPEQPIDDKKNS